MEKLLHLLESDCSLSTKQLAAMVGTSEDKVRDDMARYEKEHIILGYKAVIDWDAVNR